MSEAGSERGGWARNLRGVLALVALAVLVVSLDALHAPLMGLLDRAGGLIAEHPVRGGVLFVIFSALSGMLAFFSSAVLVPVAVYAWGPVRCAALLWLGWILGGVLTYSVGATLGRPVARLLTSPELLDRFASRVSARTPFSAALLLQLALPSEVPGYLLGLARYGLRRYLLVLAVAELPYAIGTVALGESFVRQKALPFVALGALAVLVGALAWRRLHRSLDG